MSVRRIKWVTLLVVTSDWYRFPCCVLTEYKWFPKHVILCIIAVDQTHISDFANCLTSVESVQKRVLKCFWPFQIGGKCKYWDMFIADCFDLVALAVYKLCCAQNSEPVFFLLLFLSFFFFLSFFLSTPPPFSLFSFSFLFNYLRLFFKLV